jgi:hypothetical protein
LLSSEKNKYESNNENDTAAGEKIIEQEKLQIGNVQFKVFVDYLKSCNLLFSMLFMACYFLMNVCQALGGQWLSEWSNSYTLENPSTSVDTYLLVYCLIGFFQSIF